jgi:lysophospholipase L1-like esterase
MGARFWRSVPLAAAGLLAVVMAAAFVSVFAKTPGAEVLTPAATPAEIPPGNLFVLAMGDSLTRGRGDTEAGGYVGRVAELLRTGNRQVAVENLGIDSLESSGLLDLVAHPNVDALAARADLILISIGGNDLSHSLGRVRSGPEEALALARDTLTRNLDVLLTRLRADSPRAKIRILSIYNPSFGDLARADDTLILEWNDLIARAALAHGAEVVPIADLIAGHPTRLAADHYHPNSEGAALIARRVFEGL